MIKFQVRSGIVGKNFMDNVVFEFPTKIQVRLGHERLAGMGWLCSTKGAV